MAFNVKGTKPKQVGSTEHPKMVLGSRPSVQRAPRIMPAFKPPGSGPQDYTKNSTTGPRQTSAGFGPGMGGMGPMGPGSM